MMFFLHVLLGSILVVTTVIVHSICIVLMLRRTQAWVNLHPVKASLVNLVVIFSSTTLALLALHAAYIWIWALCYLLLGEFSSLERALYFSSVTYSTLGYGDITLSKAWQLLSGFEAVNGLILFGTSSAYLFAVFGMLYRKMTRDKYTPMW
jgi:voltage-gated potassium channel